ncbi:MAG TPA: DUF2891 domain-containing protein [Woeseiaceae bacterium]|nr:DUF2891 domain-containing protein [Woeseiaceae bacterium]
MKALQGIAPAALVGVILSVAMPAGAAEPVADSADRFMQLALDCVHREYPNKISHILDNDGDVAPPRLLYPVFYGCYDWHSAVHGHWLLLRLLRLNPESRLAAQARAALNRSLSAEGVAQEVDYLRNDRTFERPYGTAWLLQLTAELREWQDDDAQRWLETLKPLETAAVDQYLAWLPKLAYPIRLGTHNQTAFAFALVLDWTRVSGHSELQSLLEATIRAFYLADRACPLSYEPSGEDFLSPCLMEADLMRRVMAADAYAKWLHDFLPGIPTDGGENWLSPGVVLDPTDGKLVHLDGVNLSRAWNLLAIAAALPPADRRRASLLAAATVHSDAGIAAVSGQHYEGGHWLASFATYLTSRRWAAESAP